MAKDKEQVQKFIEALEDAGFEPRSYSGRGMFGKECVAVSGEDASPWNIAKELFSEVHDGAFDWVSEPRQDQLGRGVILYWPYYEWPAEEVA